MADYQMPPNFQSALLPVAQPVNPQLRPIQPQAQLQAPAGFPQSLDELLGTNKPLALGNGASAAMAQPVSPTLSGQYAGSTMGAADGPYGPMLSSAGGARVGTPAYALGELQRQMMVNSGGVDALPPAQALQMAMGQTNTWTDQLQQAQKQALAERLGLGDLGVRQQQAATEQGRLDLEKAKAIYSSSPNAQKNADRMALQAQGMTPEKIELTIAQRDAAGVYGQGLQLPGMGGAPAAAPAAPGAVKPVSGGALEQALGGAAPGAQPAAATPNFRDQPPAWWGRVNPLLQDAKGNSLPPDQIKIGDILAAINREAPQDFMANPNNVWDALNLAAVNIPGGMDAIKSHVQPGAYGRATELIRSGMRRLAGGDAVSPQDALNTAIANSQGWKTGAQGISPAEAFTPGVQVPILTNMLLQKLGMK
jgi:hypothetical protein